MKAVLVLTVLSIFSGCAFANGDKKQEQQPQKVCAHPDGNDEITVCDFGAVVTVFGKGWGNSFRKIDILPPEAAASTSAKEMPKKKSK